jgi:hypothetical protein
MAKHLPNAVYECNEVISDLQSLPRVTKEECSALWERLERAYTVIEEVMGELENSVTLPVLGVLAVYVEVG